MLTALLTGSPHRSSPLAGGLRALGRDVVVADSRDEIATLTVRMGERSIGAYVQLAMEADEGWSWAPAVMQRIEAMALVAPLLAPNSAVVIVADDPADPARDQRVADGLCLLAEAAVSAGTDAAVLVSVAREASPDAISRALERDSPEGSRPAPLAEIGADRDYADWRSDVFNLTSMTDVTYFGWLNQEQDRRFGLLRGSVVSPLAVPPDAPISWGDAGPGARALGQALITDALGSNTVDDDLVEFFVKDVIAPMAATGFELSATEVAAWLRRHYTGPGVVGP